MRKFKVFLMVILATFLVAGSAMALPLNTGRTGPVIPAGNYLQDVFDGHLIDLNVINDQTIVANWVDTDGDGHGKAVHVENSDLAGDLYIYDPNSSSIGLLFDDDWISQYNSDVTTTFDYQSQIGKMVITSADGVSEFDWSGEAFGFAFATNSNPSTYFYTEDDKNGGDPLALTYHLKAGDSIKLANGSDFLATSDDWIVAFEANSGRSDFDEGVFLIEDIKEDIKPVNPVPEPTTLALLGFGLLGLAGISRRKK